MLINEDDFKAALPITSNFTFSKLVPDIRRAELKYLKPILGVDLLSILEGKYNADPQTLDEDDQALMAFIHPALAHLAFWLYIPKGNVYLGENGVQAMHGSDNKPAFQHQVEALEASMRDNGFDALDELIEYLEEVAVTDFPEWLESEACTLQRSNFINTARRFTEFVPKLRGSRYLFTYLKPIMSRVERPLIRSVAGVDLYAELKAEILADNLSDANLSLLEFIEPAVAHAAWSASLFELGLQIDAEGIHLLNNTFSGTTRAKLAAETDRIRVVKDEHEAISADFLKQLQDYLVEHVDDYPLFKNGKTYDADDEDPQFENDDDNGLVML